MLEVLAAAGFNEEEALRTYATLHTYTIGFAALEASRSKWESTSKRFYANVRQLSSCATTRRFNIGLEVLLHGPSIEKYVRGAPVEGRSSVLGFEHCEEVRVKPWSFWSDPAWRGLRVLSFITASATIVILIVYLSGTTSWDLALITSVLTNIGVMIAVVIRTAILRSHRAPN
jgi:hypothetical protein